MSKRNNDWSKQKLEKYLKEGRGKGDFASYKPWLTVQDFPSSGRASGILGNKTKRVHHFFSDLETQCFYLWDWDQKVIDIKEHYPLLNLYDVVDVEDINVNSFKDKYTDEPYVLATTFLILVRTAEGGIDCFARSVKYKSGLEKSTTMEKLELERRYWKAQGVDWAIITEDDIPKEKAKNIQWFHGVLNEYKNYDVDEKIMVRLCGEFLDYANSCDLSIRKLAKDFEVKNSLKDGTGIFIFKYLLAARVVQRTFKLAINKYYNTSSKNPLTTTYQLMIKEYFRNIENQQDILSNDQLPTYEQFKYWFYKNRNYKKEVVTRFGSKKYEQKHRAILGNTNNDVLGPGSLYQIDATVADVYVVSEFNRNWIIGRPVLYMVLDSFSRMIVGFYVGLEGPSFIGAAMALASVVEDKVKLCREYGIEITPEEWPVNNLPDHIIADRGEMEGKNIESLVQALGIGIKVTRGNEYFEIGETVGIAIKDNIEEHDFNDHVMNEHLY